MARRNDQSGREIASELLDLGLYFLGLAVRKKILGIHAAAEGNLAFELGLQVIRLHAGRKCLDRMNGVHAGLDQKRDRIHDGTAGMIDDLCSIAVDDVDQSLGARNDEFLDQLGADHQASLAAHVVADQDCVDPALGRIQEDVEGFFVEGDDLFINIMNHLRLGYHVHKGRLHTKRGAEILEVAAPCHADHDLVIRSLVDKTLAFRGIDVQLGIRPREVHGFDVFDVVALREAAVRGKGTMLVSVLLDDVVTYAGRDTEAVIVFDGAQNSRSDGSVERVGGVRIMFSRAGDSADKVIEKIAWDARARGVEPMVVTSDASIQNTVFGGGVDRMSADGFSSAVDRNCYEFDLDEHPKPAIKNTVAERLRPDVREKLAQLRDSM